MHRTKLMGLAVSAALGALAAAGLVIGPAPTPAAAQAKATYVGNASCKMCHNKKDEGAQWDQWHGTLHAKAIETLKGDKAKEAAAKAGLKTPPAESPECVQCHLTGYDVKAKAAPPKIKPDEGVGCEACHGPGSLHQADAMKAKKDPSVDPKKSIVTKPEEKVCTACHNDKSPTFKGFNFEEMSKKIAHPNPKKPAA